jgi:RNA polymerase sigma factor (TIGR02999 family)
MEGPGDITRLLRRARDGGSDAMDALSRRVYDQLHRIAGGYLAREGCGHTLSTTALVNEAYVAMLGQEPVEWQDRAHFFGYAATAMRHILVDYARRRGAAKRGRGQQIVDWTASDLPVEDVAVHMLTLDAALDRLARADRQLARLVELRFFAGMSIPDTAQALGMSARNVNREWHKARLFLRAAMSEQ